MVKLSNLKLGQRYLFYKNTPNNTQIIFKANFIDIINNTLRVNEYYENDIYVNSVMVTMPISWIKKVETLNEITNKQLLLPEEILLIID